MDKRWDSSCRLGNTNPSDMTRSPPSNPTLNSKSLHYIAKVSSCRLLGSICPPDKGKERSTQLLDNSYLPYMKWASSDRRLDNKYLSCM